MRNRGPQERAAAAMGESKKPQNQNQKSDDTQKNTTTGSGKKKKGKSNDKSDVFLAKWRPQKRFSVFALFLSICLAILILHDPCDVKAKNKQDCGFPGISAMQCKVAACFVKGGGELDTKTITLKRTKGERWGLHIGPDGVDGTWFFITGIQDDGPVAKHNAELQPEAEDRIMVADAISSVDGISGQEMVKALGSTDKESVVFQVRRSKLPSFLRFLHKSAVPGLTERLLTSPGAKTWLKSSSSMGGLALAMWYVSGYPLGSLPMYYLGLTAVTSWHMMRCCHDNAVQPGVPHCYQGTTAQLDVVVKKMLPRLQGWFAKVAKDPIGFLRGLLVPADLLNSF